MKSIRVEDFIKLRKQIEQHLNEQTLRTTIYQAIRSKLEGYVCNQCQGDLWAVGVVISDDHLCSDCLGIEQGSANDIEFDICLEKVY